MLFYGSPELTKGSQGLGPQGSLHLGIIFAYSAGRVNVGIKGR